MSGTDGGAFPVTRHSVIDALDSPSADARRQAWETLCAAYWRPVYAHLRRSWHLEPGDAEDLTQDFFARALQGGVLERFGPGRAKFRTFIRVCLDRFCANVRKAQTRLKRGGGQEHLSLEFNEAERDLTASIAVESDVDEAFRQEVVRSLFAKAASALRDRCAQLGKGTQFAIFERYDLHDRQAGGDPPTYAALATEFDIPVTQVTNHLAAMRRAFRAAVLTELRAITADESEFRDEARELFGIDVT